MKSGSQSCPRFRFDNLELVHIIWNTRERSFEFRIRKKAMSIPISKANQLFIIDNFKTISELENNTKCKSFIRILIAMAKNDANGPPS